MSDGNNKDECKQHNHQCVLTGSRHMNIFSFSKQRCFILSLDGSAPRITGPEINVVAVSGEKEVKVVVGGNITTVVGTRVEILCPVTALPNATITWLFKGSTVEKENRRLLELKNSVLTLSGVTPEDIGSYTCLANNSYGEDTRTTFLSLIGKYLNCAEANE